MLVFFPAAFSGICTKELHTATDLAEKYDAAGAEVFGISVDSPYALKAFKRDEGLKRASCRTSIPRAQVAEEYGAYIPEAGVATRATFVIDKDGKVAHKVVNHPGEARDQEENIEALAGCPI